MSKLRVRKKRKLREISSIFSDTLNGEWIPLTQPEFLELSVDSLDEINSDDISGKIVKVTISLSDDEEIDKQEIESFLKLHTLSFQFSIVRARSRRVRIKEKLATKSPEDAIRSFMSKFPPIDPEKTLSFALECLVKD